jgi:hypothetical protein
MWRTAARVFSANASVSDGIGNRGIVSLLPLRLQDHACARMLVLNDRCLWIINMGMRRGFWRVGIAQVTITLFEHRESGEIAV